jgi:hypothetical protein
LFFIPVFPLYGHLCTAVSLNKLLRWGTIIAIPQMVPLAFIHSASIALLLAVPIGLIGGIAQAAYNDLAMRSCPTGLQGTLMPKAVVDDRPRRVRKRLSTDRPGSSAAGRARISGILCRGSLE